MIQLRKKFNQKGLIGTALLLAAAGVAIYGGISYIVTSGNSSFLGILRQLAVFIDAQVYSVASWAYSIFYEVSSSSLLSSLNLYGASQRLYTLLGIFMLFRLAFSFIKYIINPDGMEKGTSKFLSNLAISLVLIVSVPWIFNRAFALQTYIMDSNVIGNLIMGMNNKNSGEDSFNAASYGQAISFLTFNAFYSPNITIEDLSVCSNLLYYYSDNLMIDESGSRLNDTTGEHGSLNKEEKKIAQCINSLNNLSGSGNLQNNNDAESSTEIGTMFYIASQRYNLGLLTNPNVFNARYGNQYVISYTALVSTIAGGFLALLFLNFCFDVAIRNVKLCFLQLIAPIPIILNIEPGDTKGDKKSLNWWGKECLKTYVDLFIRVATVYFGVFLINILFGPSNTLEGSQNTSGWFKVFMIFGILLFVKQVPEMIGKAFGIDVKGQFSLNPLKRIGDNRITSMALGGVAGLATGAIGGGYAAYHGARSAGASRGEAFRRAITGGADTAVHGLTSGTKKGVKSMHDITSNARENMVRSGRTAANNVGTTLVGRTAAGAAMAMGIPTEFDRMKSNAEEMNEMGSIYGDVKSFAQKDGTAMKTSTGADLNQETRYRFKNSMGGYSTANLQNLNINSAKDAHDYVERIKTSGASAAQIKLAEDLEKSIIDDYFAAHEGDATHYVGSKLKRFNELQSRQSSNLTGVGHASSINDIKKSTSSIQSQAGAYKLTDQWTTAEKNAAAARARNGK